MGKVIKGAYTLDEIEIVKNNYGALTSNEIGLLIGRSGASVKTKARELGLVKEPSKSWTEEEDEYLKNNFLSMKYKDMAEQLNRSYGSVRVRCGKLGLKKHDFDWSESNLSFLKENYYTMPNKEIAEKLDKTIDTIENKAFSLGLKKKRYSLDKDYFEIIDTEEKAYWLGFIYADGCVRELKGKANVTIGLSLIDERHLEKFKECIKSNIPIHRYIHPKGLYETSRITVNSTKMAYDLIKLGCVPNKTYKKISMPNINTDLKIHFIRGFLDGDGWISIKKSGVGGSIGMVSNYSNILIDIQNILESNNISSILRQEKRGHFTLNIGKKTEQIKFIKLIYNNPKIYLDRKYENSKIIMKWSS